MTKMNFSWQKKLMFPDNINEQTFWYLWIDSCELTRHILNDYHNMLWFNSSAVWWCPKPNLSNNSDDICQRITKGFVWWIITHNHRSKLKIIELMVIVRWPYQFWTKPIFSSPVICGNILNTFWGRIKNSKCLYKIHQKTWSCIMLLEIVVCGRHCLILGIYDVGFTQDTDSVMWIISNGIARICHYHSIFAIYE